jgi:hypothetical protein
MGSSTMRSGSIDAGVALRFTMGGEYFLGLRTRLMEGRMRLGTRVFLPGGGGGGGGWGEDFGVERVLDDPRCDEVEAV